MEAERWDVPTAYRPFLDLRETQQAIRLLKECFSERLAAALNLMKVEAPLFVESGSGINDDLNGVEQPIRFRIRNLGGCEAEVVQSLAKWKRVALAELGMVPGEGLYTDMRAIRPDESPDVLHSILVDQWDWERVIEPRDRHLTYLKRTVRTIYRVLREVEVRLGQRHPILGRYLPDEITFVHAEDLERSHPDLTPLEREDRITARYGAVFIVGIGAPLGGGTPHDGRAPDYDDWITPNGRGRGLNGDILVWHPVLARALELSSMGIRVVPETLRQQLEMRGCPERAGLPYHRRLLDGGLPCSIGGGIGQSRVCLFLLRKAHIGEVQAGLWPERVHAECRRRNIPLL
jgi:aspartate--ammonia ligase